MLIRFTVCSLCILTYYDFSYFTFWFSGRDFGSDCISSWSLINFDVLVICFNLQMLSFFIGVGCRQTENV